MARFFLTSILVVAAGLAVLAAIPFILGAFLSLITVLIPVMIVSVVAWAVLSGLGALIQYNKDNSDTPEL